MTHLLIETVASVHRALDEVGDSQATFLASTAKAQLLTDLVRAEARLSALKLRVLAAAGDVAEEHGARDAGAWLAATTRLDRRETSADSRLAAELDVRWTRLATALAAGEVTVAQARVIAQALAEVADELDNAQLVEAEQTMIVEAKALDPRQLRILGRHLADVVDPEAAQEREARRLAEQEKRAGERVRLSLRCQGDGTTRISGVLPDAIAARLETTLESFAQPRKQAADADGLRTPRHRLLGLALGDLLERIDPQHLPAHGGDATTVIVTMTLEQLRTELAAVGLGYDEDTPITASDARRLACNAHLLPMVLGGSSQVLDAGRAARLHTPAMRKVIRLRDKSCRAAGCGVKAEWCDVHHWTPWSHGGKTSVADGGLLCSHHHHRIHDPAYDHTRHPDGTVTFHRRC